MQLMKFTEEGYRTFQAQIEQNLPHYQAHDGAWFQQRLQETNALQATDVAIPDHLAATLALAKPTDDPAAREKKLWLVGPQPTDDERAAANRHNAPLIHKALRGLPRYLAVDQHLWAALLHTTFFDYVCGYCAGDMENSNKISKNFFASVIGEGQKRSLFVNIVSALWWACTYLYDEDAKDPYHFLDILVPEKVRFAGTITPLGSSNISENPDVLRGLFRVLEERRDRGLAIVRDDDITHVLRYLNLLAGNTVIDMMSADDIAELVRKYFAARPGATKAFQLGNAPAPQTP